MGFHDPFEMLAFDSRSVSPKNRRFFDGPVVPLGGDDVCDRSDLVLGVCRPLAESSTRDVRDDGGSVDEGDALLFFRDKRSSDLNQLSFG